MQRKKFQNPFETQKKKPSSSSLGCCHGQGCVA
jgi:hypothetical protein